jgi:hypothetical protein
MASYWSKRRKLRHEVECQLDDIDDNTANDERRGSSSARVHRWVQESMLTASPDKQRQQTKQESDNEEPQPLPDTSDQDQEDELLNQRDEEKLLQAYSLLFAEEEEPEPEYLDSYSESDSDHSVDELWNSLVKWVSDYSVKLDALSGLLVILQKYYPDLPKDGRTLLGTKTTAKCVEIAGGSYVHFGIKKTIEQKCAEQPAPQGDTIAVKVNIDGLPLYKSSNSQLWPILCMFDNQDLNQEPFAVGIFCGKTKPSPVNDYLQQFVREAEELYALGFLLNQKPYNFKISAFVCDTPARSLIKATKGHMGYGGCDKCVQRGVHKGRMTFPETDAELRTDYSFNRKLDKDHHTGTSALQTLPLGMVSHFPLDHMHLVCLGVQRKLFYMWLKGPLKTRMGPADVALLSDKVVAMKSNAASEFCRKPRGVHEFERWKATEFRQFLMYTGMVALLDILPKPMYDNFMLLSVAMTILLSQRLVNQYRDKAHSFLVSFVSHFGQLYGSEMITYNIHGLVHLAQESEKFGSLDNISAFPFENYLQSLKRMVRKPSFILQQIDRRLSDKVHNPVQATTFPQLRGQRHGTVTRPGEAEFRTVLLKDYKLQTATENDNCVVLNSRQIVIVDRIINSQEGIRLMYREFTDAVDFFIYPCQSSLIGIYQVTKLSSVSHICLLSDVASKCVLLPAGQSKVAIPLLHC